MPSKRIFIAVDISDDARRLAAEHIDRMRQQAKDVRVRWEKPEKIHVTVKFLGNDDGEKIGAVNDATAAVAQEFSPFEIAIVGTGVFPNARQPRVLWLRIENAGLTLRQIAAEIDSRLSGIGFEKEKRRFSPHVTIARVREPKKAKRLAEVHLQSPIVSQPFTVGELVVYESQLKPTGSAYTVISRHRLERQASVLASGRRPD
jgi:RNA 2',3'-cyclic 3'-phosphodiesterase